LDEGFEDLVREKLGRDAVSLLKPRTLAELHRYFDSAIKGQFNPYDEECEEEYEIPIIGAPDKPAINLVAGYLKLQKFPVRFGANTRNEIQRIYIPIFRQILDLVEKQLQTVSFKSSRSIKVHFWQ
jgi:hypothetical protein